MSTWEQLDAWAAEQMRKITPAWYTPTKQRATQNRHVARGKHPMGLELANNGETCGSCRYLLDKQYREKRYKKCELVANTSGPATDIRLKWGACERWESTQDDHQADDDAMPDQTVDRTGPAEPVGCAERSKCP